MDTLLTLASPVDMLLAQNLKHLVPMGTGSNIIERMSVPIQIKYNQ